MQEKAKYLSILFCMTSGLNDEHLGSDEHEIINICNLIVDIKQCKTVDIYNVYLKTTRTHQRIDIYSNEARTMSCMSTNVICLESFIVEVIFYSVF